jgi:hypothetical protein
VLTPTVLLGRRGKARTTRRATALLLAAVVQRRVPTTDPRGRRPQGMTTSRRSTLTRHIRSSGPCDLYRRVRPPVRRPSVRPCRLTTYESAHPYARRHRAAHHAVTTDGSRPARRCVPGAMICLTLMAYLVHSTH